MSRLKLKAKFSWGRWRDDPLVVGLHCLPLLKYLSVFIFRKKPEMHKLPPLRLSQTEQAWSNLTKHAVCLSGQMKTNAAHFTSFIEKEWSFTVDSESVFEWSCETLFCQFIFFFLFQEIQCMLTLSVKKAPSFPTDEERMQGLGDWAHLLMILNQQWDVLSILGPDNDVRGSKHTCAKTASRTKKALSHNLKALLCVLFQEHHQSPLEACLYERQKL